MSFFDISMTIEKSMPVYKNLEENKPKIRTARDFSQDGAYESELFMNLHTGTHIDMPLHMIKGGDTSDKLDLPRLITDCRVLDLTHVTGSVTANNLQEKNINTGEFILLKTKNSYSDVFEPGYVFLDASGAAYLKDLHTAGVGIDALGIERAQPGHETHRILLGNGIIIIEGLRLADVPEGIYRMLALPLKISHVEALPARVVLLS